MRPAKVVGYDSHLSQFLFIINKRRNIQYFFAFLLQNKQSRPRLILSRGILLRRFAREPAATLSSSFQTPCIIVI